MNHTPVAPHTQVHRFTAILAQEQVEVITKPGLPAWNQVLPSAQLFIENAIINSGASVLLFGCHLGPLAAYLVRHLPEVQVSITDHNHTSLEMTRLTLDANRVHQVDLLPLIELPQVLYHKFSTAYIQIPKGRQLARRWLIQASHALVPNGSLYLAGPNASGVHSVIQDAQGWFGNGTVLAYKKGNRIARFINRPIDHPEPDWAHFPGITPSTWLEFPLTISDRVFRIRSLPGVFSYDHLDEGTQMLLSAVHIPLGARVLDIGCGYGVIGLFAATKGAKSVDLVDNDLLAIAACRETLSLNSISIARVFTGDLLDPVSGNMYDLILSNPPFHAGHAVNYQIAEALIDQSYEALKPGGALILVANRFIRYDRLIKTRFGEVSILSESPKFHVLSGLKSS